jgi:hypothetical protein
MNRLDRNRLALISDSYKSSQRRIAREKGRSDRPEDVFAQGFASTVLAAFVGMITRFFGLFRHGKGTKPSDRRHHARFSGYNGFGKIRNPGPSGPPVDGAASSLGREARRREARKLRRYCLRGYGYIAPEGAVEKLQKKSYKTKAVKV